MAEGFKRRGKRSIKPLKNPDFVYESESDAIYDYKGENWQHKSVFSDNDSDVNATSLDIINVATTKSSWSDLNFDLHVNSTNEKLYNIKHYDEELRTFGPRLSQSANTNTAAADEGASIITKFGSCSSNGDADQELNRYRLNSSTNINFLKSDSVFWSVSSALDNNSSNMRN